MVVVGRTWWKVYITMTISSAMNVLIKFVISITFSFAFSFSKNDDMHLVIGIFGGISLDHLGFVVIWEGEDWG